MGEKSARKVFYAFYIDVQHDIEHISQSITQGFIFIDGLTFWIAVELD